MGVYHNPIVLQRADPWVIKENGEYYFTASDPEYNYIAIRHASSINDLQKAPETVEKYRKRLEAKLAEVLEDKSVDEQRIITEAAIFADKIAVDEETVRLRSHIAQIRALLDSGEPVGRKLDFVLQESNREINTIGSKSQNTEISKVVVDVKSELEKIREQIQNIE